jgi:hypothetical protein
LQQPQALWTVASLVHSNETRGRSPLALFHLCRAIACSVRRRIASEREGRSGCMLRQSSIALTNSSGARRCNGVSCTRPAGRPELLDAALALRDAVEKAKPIIETIEARWGKDVWERHRKSRAE